MKIDTINGNKVEYYTDIDQIPMTRYHPFNKYIMLDSGIGSDVDGIDRRMASTAQMISKGDHADAINEINNMRQALAFVMNNVNPEMMAFATMVKSVNGVPCDDMSHDGLQRVLDMIGQSGVSLGVVKSIYNEIKKKLKIRSQSTSRRSRMASKYRSFLHT